MPWFPDFVAAAELARRDLRAAGQADPVAQYFAALIAGDAHVLETVWPGEVVIFDPRAGEVRGHRHLRQFVRQNRDLWAERHATIETIASTADHRRAVVELVARLADEEGDEVLWPLAVVAECSDDRSVVFRTYCSQLPVDGRRHVRPAILGPGPAPLDDAVSRFHLALGAGDVDAILGVFAADGYVREAIGPDAVHRGRDELRAFFARSFRAGGGIGLEDCVVTDDGARCALELNYLRWGEHDLTPQAGLTVFERDGRGGLAAVRIYDDVEPPAAAA